MKITDEQRDKAEELTKLHIRPAVVKQELLKLNPEVGECHINNLVKNTRKRLGFYNKEKYHTPKTKAEEKERKKSKKRNKRYRGANKKKNRKQLLAEDLY